MRGPPGVFKFAKSTGLEVNFRVQRYFRDLLDIPAATRGHPRAAVQSAIERVSAVPDLVCNDGEVTMAAIPSKLKFTDGEAQILFAVKKAKDHYEGLVGTPPGEREYFLMHIRALQGLVASRALRRNLDERDLGL